MRRRIDLKRRISVVGAMIGLLGLGGVVLVVAVDARGDEGLDLTGTWSIELGGPEPQTCEAAFDHLPGRTSIGLISLACSVFGQGGGFGIFDPDTNGVQISADFPYAAPAIHVTLEGTATPDGQSFSGVWFESYDQEQPNEFTATREGPLVSPLPTLPEPVDISGTWRIDFTGSLTGSCEAVVQQKGRKLHASAECDVIGRVLLWGRIDASTGAFSLGGGGAGGGVGLEGVASDSESESGTWTSFPPLAGTFTAERAGVDYIDVNGEWDAVVEEEPGTTCKISFRQDLLLLDVSLDCGELGAGEFGGSIDPIGGSVSLDGSLGDIEMGMGGRAAADGSSFFGWVYQRRAQWRRQLIAVPQKELDRGVIAVDCRPDREGLQTECGGRTNDDLTVAVEAVVLPANLPQRVEMSLVWPADVIAYHPAPIPQDEAVAGQCDDVERTVGTAGAEFSCLLPADVSQGPLFSLTLTCLREASVTPDLGWLDLEEVGPVGPEPGPVLIDAVIAPCAGVRHGGYPLGDADCGGSTDSVDGALVLQFEAQVIDSLECWRAADANRDEHVDSVDASVILQCGAALTDVCR